ncbi:ankyrin repeat domain-containing protein 34B [Myxocyprinus asiaticus]|uniref:ankyrin repeat domain-containing protein 34B n=1 Tax=Myxocyprinus asiaticus TaxID=70543 RepID=UPI002223AF17|nr:ankyrin repeat domain-containing protein 34B [Myxocyprinus asiaticus]
MAEPQDYLMDGTPLITAALLGKLRLVRLLVEGGAQVNKRNQRGETPLLAACRALRGDQCGTTMLKLIQFLLNNQADPNIQDKSGRTALMYACMERAGVEVASALIAAGADPSMEDYAGASALVYAINAHHQDTLQVLLDACQARGRDIIIIATDLNCDGSSVTRRYLNVPPSPDNSPVSCMSPSDIELKTSSPNSEGENIFNFRGGEMASPLLQRSSSLYRQRLRSEPWLAIQNLAHLTHTYEKNFEESVEDNKDENDESHEEDQTTSSLRSFQSASQLKKTDFKPKWNQSGQERQQSRRNTLPDLQGQSLLQLPSLKLTLSSSDTHLHELLPASSSGTQFPSIYRTSSLFLSPPSGIRDFSTTSKKKPREQLSAKPPSRRGFLPPLPVSATVNAFLPPVCRDPNPESRSTVSLPVKQEAQSGRSLLRRHSIQLGQINQTGCSEETQYLLRKSSNKPGKQ